MTDRTTSHTHNRSRPSRWLRDARTWQSARRIVQALSFLAFVWLLIASWSAGQASATTSVFFKLNPLTALASMIAARAWIPAMGWALVTVAATLLVGRVWCGWICPLGTTLDWIRFPKASQRATSISPAWRAAKYVLLAVIVGLALTGSLTLLVLDPITIMTRAFATGLLPALNAAITRANTALYRVAWMRPAVSWVEATLRGTILPTIQSAYQGSLAMVALLAAIIALNALADRFWCRYLCPLGGLLGLLSRFALFRPLIGSRCSACDHCMTACSMEAIRPSSTKGNPPREIVASECTLCLDCMAACSASGIKMALTPLKVEDPAYDPSRRHALAAMGAGVAGALLLNTEAAAKDPDPRLIRPPGVTDEDDFLATCIRCGECMHVCATTGLQPSLFESGLRGFGAPHLVPRLGPCDYSCNACGQVCPTGAISLLDLATKRQQVIGMAVIDRNRCLPWAYDTPCIVCEEMCPIPDKAIRVDEVEIEDAYGNTITIQRPYVVLDLCIGCGICEFNCPMEAQAAIQVQRR